MNDDQARASLQDMIGGYRATALVSTAARLNLPDLLTAGRRTAEELAASTGVRPDRLLQFLRALVSVGLLEQQPDGDRAFGLTALGRPLCSDAPDSMRSAAIYFGAVSAPSFEALADVLASDLSGFQHRHGTDFYEYLDTHPELAAHYNTVIAVEGLGTTIAEAYDFSGAASVADIGGGRGTTLGELLRARQHLSGVLQEIPHVMAEAKEVLEDPALEGRARSVTGSFLDRVEPGSDIYLLIRVLPNWDDDDALRILRNCREAMTGDGRLLIADAEMTEQVSSGSFAPIGDLHAMVHFGGKLRSRAELSGLLAAAGLRLAGVHTLPGIPHWSLFEAEVAS